MQINDDLKQVTVDGEFVKLTPIEYNILLLLMKNQGKVFSINQIYESIWNEEAIGADNTVAVHIRHIREKIEINPKDPRYLKVSGVSDIKSKKHKKAYKKGLTMKKWYRKTVTRTIVLVVAILSGALLVTNLLSLLTLAGG